MVFVFIVFCGAVWRLSFEKSGLIYYPASGAELISLSAKIEADGNPATAKLTNMGSGVSTPYYITSGVTFSDLITIEFENGAQLSGVTPILPPPANIIAGKHQKIFDGPVSFSSPGRVQLGWWAGAPSIASGDRADNLVACDRAWAARPGNGYVIEIDGLYGISGIWDLTSSDRVVLLGDDNQLDGIYNYGTGACIQIHGSRSEIHNLSIRDGGLSTGGDGSGTTGIIFQGADNIYMNNVEVRYHNSAGIEFDGGNNNHTLFEVESNFNGGDGLYSVSAGSGEQNGNAFSVVAGAYSTNSLSGIYFGAAGISITGMAAFELNGKNGIFIDANKANLNSNGTTIIGNYFELNNQDHVATNAPIRLLSNAAGNKNVIGCIISGNYFGSGATNTTAHIYSNDIGTTSVLRSVQIDSSNRFSTSGVTYDVYLPDSQEDCAYIANTANSKWVVSGGPNAPTLLARFWGIDHNLIKTYASNSGIMDQSGISWTKGNVRSDNLNNGTTGGADQTGWFDMGSLPNNVKVISAVFKINTDSTDHDYNVTVYRSDASAFESAFTTIGSATVNAASGVITATIAINESADDGYHYMIKAVVADNNAGSTFMYYQDPYFTYQVED